MKNDELARRSDPYKPKTFRQKKFKEIIRSQIGRLPLAGTRVIKLWRNSKFLFLKSKWELESSLGNLRGIYGNNLDINKTYWISPQKIIFSSLKEFNIHDFKGHILGGNWDRLEKRFDTLDLYVAFKQVFSEGVMWSDTFFFHNLLDEIAAGHHVYGCHDKRDLVKRCQYIESLFYSIKNNGYKSQRELFLTGQIQDPVVAEEEITVSIGRDGDLLFSDGAHRLAIAKLLEVPAIPVKVAVRHTAWIKLRNDLFRYSRDETVTRDGKLYQPITHPDLSDLPASHECDDRFQMIKENMLVRQGSVLDIGANLGYFCHRFEEIGFDCYAVENHPSTVYFLKRLARAENSKFRIISKSVFDSQEIRNTHFDIVLALNIFHHFLKTKDSYDKLVDLLKNLQVNELYFEPYLPDEPHMENSYRSYCPDEFIEFIKLNSGLKKADFIATMKDGRSLFRLH